MDQPTLIERHHSGRLVYIMKESEGQKRPLYTWYVLKNERKKTCCVLFLWSSQLYYFSRLYYDVDKRKPVISTRRGDTAQAVGVVGDDRRWLVPRRLAAARTGRSFSMCAASRSGRSGTSCAS